MNVWRWTGETAPDRARRDQEETPGQCDEWGAGAQQNPSRAKRSAKLDPDYGSSSRRWLLRFGGGEVRVQQGLAGGLIVERMGKKQKKGRERGIWEEMGQPLVVYFW